jgi:hypothetical protein
LLPHAASQRHGLFTLAATQWHSRMALFVIWFRRFWFSMKKETGIILHVASYFAPIVILFIYLGYSRSFLPAVAWQDNMAMIGVFCLGAFLQLLAGARQLWIGLMFYSVVMVVVIPFSTFWFCFQFFGAHL